MTITSITSFDQYQTIINSSKPVVIDFWAKWSTPCKALSPFYAEYSNMKEYSNVEFYKVDIEAQKQISEEAKHRPPPAFIVYKDGKKVMEVTGSNVSELEYMLRDAAKLA
ncbi:hypothetical protein BGZ46_001692 [Entomortierella lignicola]|nr:hypothetical protein BGZ46_001692 [Entomortierella lignicola]